jgi:hypothetical protein
VTAAWEAVVGSALAGTARQPLAGDTDDPERALLAAAAAHAVRRLAGWMPPRGAPPIVEPCPPEERDAVSPAAAARLSGMLAGGRAELVPEWLELAAAAGRLVPPRLLPALLAHAQAHGPLRQAALDVIGRRGRWLAALEPDWGFAALADLDAAFETGTRPARAAALRELRRRDPAAALGRLAASWPSESGEDRAALIGCLQVGLGSADEEFLEAARNDSRREVRQAALAFLARLPASRLVRRMRERVEPMVVYRRGLLGGRLQVAPPERCEPDVVADGVEPKPPQGTGQRAWWLSQMLGLVPPSTWPVEAAGAAGGSDWTAALLRGWAAAAARFRDARWADALAQLWARTPEKDRPALAFSPELVLIDLEPADRDAVVLGVVRRSAADGARLAVHCDHRWGAALTAAVLGGLPDLARSNLHLAGQAARQVGLRGDPALGAEAERLAAGLEDIPWFARALADAADTLHWRAVMAEELNT